MTDTIRFGYTSGFKPAYDNGFCDGYYWLQIAGDRAVVWARSEGLALVPPHEDAGGKMTLRLTGRQQRDMLLGTALLAGLEVIAPEYAIRDARALQRNAEAFQRVMDIGWS